MSYVTVHCQWFQEATKNFNTGIKDKSSLPLFSLPFLTRVTLMPWKSDRSLLFVSGGRYLRSSPFPSCYFCASMKGRFLYLNQFWKPGDFTDNWGDEKYSTDFVTLRDTSVIRSVVWSPVWFQLKVALLPLPYITSLHLSLNLRIMVPEPLFVLGVLYSISVTAIHPTCHSLFVQLFYWNLSCSL